MRTPRGQLSPLGTRVRGRKNKSPDTFLPNRCDYMIGGTEALIKRKYKNKPPTGETTYNVVIVVGGKRCWNEATAVTKDKKRCLGHIGATYKTDE